MAHLVRYAMGLSAAFVVDGHPYAKEVLRGSTARPAEERRIARLGSWDWDLATGRHVWSDEFYRIPGFTPRGFGPSHEIFLAWILPPCRPSPWPAS